MYLLTFTFLIIGILGIYTQVLAVETARMYQSQTGIGQTMIAWHEAAVSLAGNVVSPASITAAGGCGLTVNLANPCLAGSGISPAGGNVAVTGGGPGYAKNSYTINALAPNSPIYPSLPQGYIASTYQWNSVAFSNGGNYVITYASVPVAANGFISTATTQLGITDSDLYQQVRQSGIPITNFGYVTAGGSTGRILITPVTLPAPINAPIEYDVPATMPLGVFAIISGSGLCNGC